MKLGYLENLLYTIINHCMRSNKSETEIIDILQHFILENLKWVYDYTVFEELGYIHIALHYTLNTNFSYFRFSII